MEYAMLKKADMQGRTRRKWSLYNHMMRVCSNEQRVSFFGEHGMDGAPWSERDFPVTAKTFKYCLWWMAIPSHKRNPLMNPESTIEALKRLMGPRGHSFSYMRFIAYNLLSFVEEKEEVSAEKGKFVGDGDLSVIRRASSLEMKSIAV